MNRILVAVVMLGWSIGCNNIVPPKEAAAFARKEADRAWYKALVNDYLYVETSVGDFAIQLLPLKDRRLTETLKKHVQEGYYNGLRFHRAITDPVPFGVQVGDPVTRGQHGRDFVWEGADSPSPLVPVAGADAGSTMPGQITSEYAYNWGAVSLAGAKDGAWLSSQIFIHLGTNRFVENSHPVVGFVRYGSSALSRIQLGTKVEKMSVLPRAEFPEALTREEVPLPHEYAEKFKEADPDGQ